MYGIAKIVLEHQVTSIKEVQQQLRELGEVEKMEADNFYNDIITLNQDGIDRLDEILDSVIKTL